MYSFAFALLNSKLSYKDSLEAFSRYRQNPKGFLESYPQFKDMCDESYLLLGKEVEITQKLGLCSCLLDDFQYPKALGECSEAPLLLYSNFMLDPALQNYITVVGSRGCSDLGKQYAREIVEKIAKYYPGYTIVTASVPGIANVVREHAAKIKVPVVTVLGTGFQHMHLYGSALPFTYCITSHLCVQKATLSDYIKANTILAGISEKVVVIECGEKSGCIDVAKRALDYGHDVYTVFGPNLTESFSGNFALVNSNIATDYNNLFPFPAV